MNKEEAKFIIHSEVDRYKAMPYDDLVRTVGNDAQTTQQVGESGTRYLIETKTKWTNRKKGIVRVSSTIRSLDESPEESKTWNIPFSNIAICRGTMLSIATTFTRRPQ